MKTTTLQDHTTALKLKLEVNEYLSSLALQPNSNKSQVGIYLHFIFPLEDRRPL